jgi:hypothetical protein
MSEHSKADQNKVVQLNPERNTAAATVALTRLPAPMHALRDKARQQLQVLLRELFDRADDALFELADKAGNNHEQNLYFDSMREVRIRRRTMEAAFFRSIDIGFAQLLDHNAYREESPAEAREISLDDLSLVKNDELEEMVATEGMVNKANEQFAEAIQHLTLRIDHLVPVKVYQKNNPLGVDVICKAFTEAAKTARIDVKAKLVLFKLFDNLVMAKLGGLFQSLNQLLIEANIMPSMKAGERTKKPVTTAAPSNPYGAGASAQISSGNYGRQAYPNQPMHNGGTGYDEQTNQVLHTLRDLLGSRGADSGAVSSDEEIASHDLVQMLSRAQHHHPAYTNPAMHNSGSPLNLREMLNELLRDQQQKPQAINQVDDDVINLVSMMFDFILDDRNLASPMKALLGRLQIPMVKVAIADKTFFSKGGHPARRLLNEMAMAALGWQEASEENQRKDSLFSKMQEVVQQILSDFETDMGIFNTLLSDFRAYLDKDRRRAQILEQRTLDAEDGKAKSERARADVDSALKQIVGTHVLPEAANKLLRDAWANVMFITSLKQGTGSDAWQATVTTAEQLVWSLTAPMAKEDRQQLLKLVPQLLQQLRQGLESIAYNPFETTHLFKQLEGLHLARLRATSATPQPAAVVPVPVKAAQSAAPAAEVVVPSAPVSAAADKQTTQTESVAKPAASATSIPTPMPIAEIAAAKAMVSNAPVADVQDQSAATVESAPSTFVVMPVATAVDSSLAEGDQHLSLVNNITQGSWFEMMDGAGQKYRCRLAAIIKATGKYIFVNRSGMKVAEETRQSLALSLKTGRLRVLDDGMLFDRALEAVIGNLREQRTNG